MRAILTALMLTFATQAGAEGGKMCKWQWWRTASTTDVQTELDAGADVMARNKGGLTPLHVAAYVGTVDGIRILLDAGADVMAPAKYGETPLHEAARTDTPANMRILLDAGL